MADSIRKFSNRQITFESDGRFEFKSNLEASQVPRNHLGIDVYMGSY